MRIRIIGLTACLVGMACTASAGDMWSKYQVRDTAEKPGFKTEGDMWSKYQAGDTTAEKPKFNTASNMWSK